jgi:hypothetical protein
MLRTVENLIPHECSWEAPIFTPAMLSEIATRLKNGWALLLGLLGKQIEPLNQPCRRKSDGRRVSHNRLA